MKLKKGDKVVVIAGKDRGKTGEITDVEKETERVVVAGVNVVKRHKRGKGDVKGQIVEKPASIHASNVMVVDPKTGGRTRVGVERKEGKRVRVAKKSGQEIT